MLRPLMCPEVKAGLPRPDDVTEINEITQITQTVTEITGSE